MCTLDAVETLETLHALDAVNTLYAVNALDTLETVYALDTMHALDVVYTVHRRYALYRSLIGSWTVDCGWSTNFRSLLTFSESWMYQARKATPNLLWRLAIPDDIDIRVVWSSRVSFTLHIVLDRVGPINT